MPINQPQLQSSLGEVVSNKTKIDRVWNLGTMALGVVLKVHSKRYTADVRILGTNDQFTSPHSQEGRYSCKICVENAGFDEEFKKPYGKIIPIQKNSLVLVGFLKNSKEKPIILGVLHDTSEDVGENNYKNILDSLYSDDGGGEISRYLNVSPIQDFISLDREGNLEIASHNKSFLVAKSREMDIDEYDFDDLSVKTADQKVISNDQKYFNPLKVMAVFRDKFLDSATNWIKFLVDASKTSLKLMKIQQVENKSTILELNAEGGVVIKRQLDTKSSDGSKRFSEIQISDSGIISITVSDNDKMSTINVSQNGLFINTDFDIIVNSQENISLISQKNINLVAQNVNVEKLTVSQDLQAGFVSDRSLSVGSSSVNDTLDDIDQTIEEYLGESDNSDNRWITCVKTVKAMLASKRLNYSQSSNITYDFGKFKVSVHPDCSGTVTAMIALYLGKPLSQMSSSEYTSKKSLSGFEKLPWTGWGNLRQGDIISRSGHIEVFAYNQKSQHYVWNAGSTSSVQSPTPTLSSHRSYTTVWRAKEG